MRITVNRHAMLRARERGDIWTTKEIKRLYYDATPLKPSLRRRLGLHNERLGNGRWKIVRRNGNHIFVVDTNGHHHSLVTYINIEGIRI